MVYSYGFGFGSRKSKGKAALLSLDFSSVTPGAYTPPGTIGFTRASTATVQTSAVTVVTNISADQARVGDDGNGHKGLVIEETRDNRLIYANPASWTVPSAPNGATVTTIAGPRGTVTSARIEDTSNTVGQNITLTYSGFTVGQPYVASAWGINLDPAKGGIAWVQNNTTYEVRISPTDTTWRRLQGAWSNAVLASGTASIWPQHDTPSLLGTIGCDFCQIENGKFITEAIDSNGSVSTRAGERLWIKDCSSLIRNGALTIDIALYPKGATALYSANMSLFYKDANNLAYISNAGLLTVTIGGVSLTSTNAISWAANDLVEFYLDIGNGVPIAYYRINGGDRIAFVMPATSQASIANSGTIDLLCQGTSNQFTSRVQSISIYQPGYQPTWVSEVILDAFFNAPQSQGIASLPSWLLFTRASTATVQTGAVTIKPDVAIDQPRFGDDGNGHKGLVIEEPRTNYQLSSSGILWAGSNVNRALITGVAGTATAQSLEDVSATLQGYATASSTGLSTDPQYTYIASVWAIDLSSNVGGQYSYNPNLITSVIGNRPQATWSRFVGIYSASSSTTGTSSLIPTTLGQVALTGKMGFEFMQIEDGRFATEAIITGSGSTATRSGDRLWIADCSSVTSSGQISMEVACYPKGLQTIYKNSQILFFQNSSFNAKLAQGYAVVVVNGVTLISANQRIFNANDFVEVWVQAGNGIPQVSIRINGGTVTRYTFPATVQDPILTSGSMDLLCAGAGGNQFISRVNKIKFYKLGRKPGWV